MNLGIVRNLRNIRIVTCLRYVVNVDIEQSCTQDHPLVGLQKGDAEVSGAESWQIEMCLLGSC